MPPILGSWGMTRITDFHALICFCVSFLVVLLAVTCLIFAVRLGLVAWRHCKRPLEAPEITALSGTVAWDLWHVVADPLKGEKRIGHLLVLPSCINCLVLFCNYFFPFQMCMACVCKPVLLPHSLRSATHSPTLNLHAPSFALTLNQCRKRSCSWTALYTFVMMELWLCSCQCNEGCWQALGRLTQTVVHILSLVIHFS